MREHGQLFSVMFCNKCMVCPNENITLHCDEDTESQQSIESVLGLVQIKLCYKATAALSLDIHRQELGFDDNHVKL